MTENGTLDIGIVGTLEDGTECIVGELWAVGSSTNGERVSIDPVTTAKALGIDQMTLE